VQRSAAKTEYTAIPVVMFPLQAGSSHCQPASSVVVGNPSSHPFSSQSEACHCQQRDQPQPLHFVSSIAHPSTSPPPQYTIDDIRYNCAPASFSHLSYFGIAVLLHHHRLFFWVSESLGVPNEGLGKSILAIQTN
jgi:hypothetical protein